MSAKHEIKYFFLYEVQWRVINTYYQPNWEDTDQFPDMAVRIAKWKENQHFSCKNGKAVPWTWLVRELGHYEVTWNQGSGK